MSRWRGLYHSITDSPSAEEQAHKAFAQAREALPSRVRYVDPYESNEREVDDQLYSAGTPRPSSQASSKTNPEDETKAAALSVRRVYAHVVRDNWDSRRGSQSGTPQTSAGWDVPIDHYTERMYGDSDEESDAEATSPKAKRAKKASAALEAEAEEMQYNAGLRIFNQRRDLWTNAQSDPNLLDGSSSSSSQNPNCFIPVAQPIMMDNSARILSANPEFRISLYNKHIIQGRSLAVPVPLSQMINALVQGWKRDGEWPPNPKDLKPSVVVRRRV